MKRFLILLCVLLAVGCTTTETVTRTVEKPVPYWKAPENIKEEPARTPMRHVMLTPESAQEDTEAAFEALGEDIANLLAENEVLRHLYAELVKLCKTEPEGGVENGEHPE